MPSNKELRQYVIEFLAETFSTCTSILLGESALANGKLSPQTSQSSFVVATAFAVGVYAGEKIWFLYSKMFFFQGMTICGRISGNREKEKKIVLEIVFRCTSQSSDEYLFTYHWETEDIAMSFLCSWINSRCIFRITVSLLDLFQSIESIRWWSKTNGRSKWNC